MARAKFWSRYCYNPTWNAANNAFFDLVGTLQPGETLLRSVISKDTWLNSTTVPFVDGGARAAWGLIAGDSNTSPPFLPLDSFGQVSIPWLYIDQTILDVVQESVVAGSVSYFARSSELNRYTDSSRQYAVPGATPKYLWLCEQFVSGVGSNATLYAANAASFLILGPP